MTRRIMSTVTALALVIAALVFTGLTTATATQTGGDCTTEYSGWVKESPGEGWIKIATRTVVDKEAYDEKVKDAYDEVIEEGVDQWWHWNSPNDPTGPPPGESWNTDNGNHNGIPAPPNTVYNVSHGESGNASWFFHQFKERKVVHHDAEYVHHDAVTHQEFKYKKVTCPPDGPTPVPVPALFAAEPEPPTCDEPGSFDFSEEHPNVTVTVTPAYDGPGTYTLTVTADEGFEFPDGTTTKSRTITVLGAIGFQSTDSEAPCYLAPGDEPTTLAPPTVVDECGTENDLVTLPENTESVTYRFQDEATSNNVEALVADGFLVLPVPAGWVEIDTDTYRYEVPAFTDEDCPTPPPPGDNPGDNPGGDTPGDDTPATGTNIPTTSSGAPASPPSSGVPTSIDAGQ